MLKEVARMWNVNGHTNEDSFDPLVNMLVTAVSSESELIYKEIGRSEDRVAESLMSKLIPYVNKGVQPGHTMVLLNPGELNIKLPQYTELVSHVRSFSEQLKEAHFITVHDVNLFQGGVVRVSSSVVNYDVVDYRFKVENDRSEKDIKTNQLIIDVEYFGGKLDHENIPLFFDLKIVEYKRRLFYESLARASFFIDGIAVSRIKPVKADPLIEENERSLASLENSVRDFYHHQYFELEVPASLRRNDAIRDKKKKSTFSITIEFGSFLNADVIKELFCYVNAVPVINVRKNHKIFKAGNNLSVFHLLQNDPFYCIKSIYSDEGKIYRKYDGGDTDNDKLGSYLIRGEEVEGLTGKNAREMIDYLVGIMRNENAVLSNISKGNFSNDLKILKQITAKMENSLAGNYSSDDSTYIFLKDEQPPEYVFVDYYTTNGDEIKGLKVNNPLSAVKGTALGQNGNFTLTPLTGGRGVLKDDEYIYEVRNALLSGGRIITPKDVSSLMQKYFGKYLIDLNIKKGMAESSDVNRGYIRTIDIIAVTDGNLSMEECNSIGKIILCELEENGAAIYPYRLIVDDKEVLK